MANGSWLMAQDSWLMLKGSWLKAQGSRLMAKKNLALGPPGPGPSTKFFLAMSHDNMADLPQTRAE